MQNSGGYDMSNVIVLLLVFFASAFFFLTIIRLIRAFFFCNHARDVRAARWNQHELLFGGSRRHGLSPSAIAAIPTYTYQRDIKHGGGSSGGWAQCAICLSFLEEGEMVRQLPGCKHLFDVECIDKWLNLHATCPLCRSLISDRIAESEKDLEAQTSASDISARVEGTAIN